MMFDDFRTSGSFAYLPQMYGPEASLSFEFYGILRVYIEILLYTGSTYVAYYLKNDGTYTTVPSYIDIASATSDSWESKSITIPLANQVTTSGNQIMQGYVNCSFQVINSGGTERQAFLKNFKLIFNISL
jgi:hypothetical protein